MKMSFRWYGEGNDSIPLNYIKQIPSVQTIVWALHSKPVGEVWQMSEILAEKENIEKHGFDIDVVESVNVHEDIKLGLPSKDMYIENYIQTIKNLGKAGVKVICFNFMPIFDWTRTELFKDMDDGATALFFEASKVEDITPQEMAARITDGSKGYTMPGWEPEKLDQLKGLFEAYKSIDEEQLWKNLKYFLDAILPAAEESGIKMAIHPDDPPWKIFGLPRIINSEATFDKYLSLSDSPSHCLTLCSGSLGASGKNDIAAMVRKYHNRIAFAHIRNVKRYDNGDFIETSHRTQDGSLDIVDIVKAYHENNFQGYIRPDHGRHIWDEKCRPGYGLYDRALGIMYILGIWDSL